MRKIFVILALLASANLAKACPITGAFYAPQQVVVPQVNYNCVQPAAQVAAPVVNSYPVYSSNVVGLNAYGAYHASAAVVFRQRLAVVHHVAPVAVVRTRAVVVGGGGQKVVIIRRGRR